MLFSLFFQRQGSFRATRLIGAAVLLAGLGIGGRCSGSENDASRTEWKIGYWLWQPLMFRTAERVVDLLYVQVGTFWSPYDYMPVRLVDNTSWSAQLPKAEAYIAVWRNTSSLTPGIDLVPALLAKYQEVKQQAAKAGQRLVGLQIDHDCPTYSLTEYARFLQGLRAALPPEDLLSITTLLDWFRPDTRIAPSGGGDSRA